MSSKKYACEIRQLGDGLRGKTSPFVTAIVRLAAELVANDSDSVVGILDRAISDFACESGPSTTISRHEEILKSARDIAKRAVGS